MKKKGFSLIELMIVISIIGLLAAIMIPAVKKAKELAKDKEATDQKKQYQPVEQPRTRSVEPPKDQIIIVTVKKGIAWCTLNADNKIELKPAFVGTNVNVFMSSLPDRATIVQENGKHYLLWTPTKKEIFKGVMTTAAPGMDKKEDKITIFVR